MVQFQGFSFLIQIGKFIFAHSNDNSSVSNSRMHLFQGNHIFSNDMITPVFQKEAEESMKIVVLNQLRAVFNSENRDTSYSST